MNFLKIIWHDRKERGLFILWLASFVVLCVVEAQVPVFDLIAVKWPLMTSFVTSGGAKTIVGGLLSGFISAYVFYVFVDLIPRERNKSQAIAALNKMIAAVLTAYNAPSPYAHEGTLDFADVCLMDSEWISLQIAFVEKCSSIQNQPNYLWQVKYAAETAHSRVIDFRHALPLAVSLSPAHVVCWVDLSTKVQLLADMYDQYPGFKLDDVEPWEGRVINEDDIYPLYISSVSVRLKGLFEHIQKWIALTRY